MKSVKSFKTCTSVIQTKEYFFKAHVDEVNMAIIESQGTHFTIILPQ